MRGMTNKEFHKKFGKNYPRKSSAKYVLTFVLIWFMKHNRKKYTFKRS